VVGAVSVRGVTQPLPRVWPDMRAGGSPTGARVCGYLMAMVGSRRALEVM